MYEFFEQVLNLIEVAVLLFETTHGFQSFEILSSGTIQEAVKITSQFELRLPFDQIFLKL